MKKGIFFGLVLAVMFLGACGTGNESQSEDKVIKVAGADIGNWNLQEFQ